jgi:hypothetical protein
MACLWKRGKTYYARYYAGTRQRAVCLGTSCRSHLFVRVAAIELTASAE